MLSRQANQIIAEELERAMNACGRRLLSLYLQDLTQAQVVAILRSPQKSQQAISDAIAQSGRLPIGMGARSVRPELIERLRLLEAEVLTKPDFCMTLAEASELIKNELEAAISATSIRGMIERHWGAHKLEVRNNKVRLRADALTEAIAVRHQERKAQGQAAPVVKSPKKRK